MIRKKDLMEEIDALTSMVINLEGKVSTLNIAVKTLLGEKKSIKTTKSAKAKAQPRDKAGKFSKKNK